MYFFLGGFDTGIGLLIPFTKSKKIRKEWINTTAPFWDANETWLVLAIGILLVAFPNAQAIIMVKLFIPIMILVLGIIIRGFAYEFRTKLDIKNSNFWHYCFFLGSLLITIGQGLIMFGYINNYDFFGINIFYSLIAVAFVAVINGVLGLLWLNFKWRKVLSEKINSFLMKLHYVFYTFLIIYLLKVIIYSNFKLHSLIFIALFLSFSITKHFYKNILNSIIIFSIELGTTFYMYSLIVYPNIVPSKNISVWDAAASTASLEVIFYGTVVMLPIILSYTIFSHFIFKDKITKIDYK
jgi:cytochrome d ubiquinol oxidase subunit II